MLQNLNGLTKEEIYQQYPSVYAQTAHESRSPKYRPISTGHVLEALREIDFVPTTVMQAFVRTAGRVPFAKHLLRLRRTCDLGDGISEVHEIVLVNSHDGSSAYVLYSGVFRTVCSNGLIVRSQSTGTMRIAHRGTVVDEVVEGTLALAQKSTQVMKQIAGMKQMQVSYHDQLHFAAYALEVRFGEKMKLYYPGDLLFARRTADSGDDLWRVFNRIQGNCVSGGVESEKGRYTRAIEGIDQNVRVNTLLWEFAENMLELKRA